jgi:DNA-binding GntR family transcriptional regulator
VAQADVAAMLAADQAFHRAIYAASGNPLIESSAMLHWTHIRRAMGQALQHSSLRASVWDEHAAMADAIARGDVLTVTQLANRHCEQASQHLRDQLRQVKAHLQQVNSVVP